MSGLSFNLGGHKTSKTQNPLATPKSANGIKRTHAALNDDSGDENDEHQQEVTHFGSSGAVNVHKPKIEKQPLIIQPQANRDWKEASKANKRTKYGMPNGDRKRSTTEKEAEIRAREEANKPTYGLNVFEKKAENGEDGSNGQSEDTNVQDTSTAALSKKPRTDDERAMDALMGKKPDSDLTIAATANTEEELFQKNFKNAPPVATLEEYAAVPVEEFGAALLRGMGWKEGVGIGNQRGKKLEKTKLPERRPALLGIGAKADAAVAEEMGAWGKASRSKKDPVIYNPIVMRNKKTGEEVTEAELQEKLRGQKYEELDKAAEYERKQKEKEREKDGDRERRRKYDNDSDEEYERKRRERRREREREDKDRSSRRDTDRSYDKDRERRKDRDYDDRRDSERKRDRDDRDLHRSRRDRDDRNDRHRDSRRDRR